MSKCQKSVKAPQQKARQILLQSYYSPKQAARVLNKTKQTILNWCEAGKLEAIESQYGKQGRTTYKIPRVALEQFKENQKLGKQLVESIPLIKGRGKHKNLLDSFKECLALGALDKKRVYSDITIDFYIWHMEHFFEEYDFLTADAVEAFINKMPAKQFAQREKFHRAAVCLSKYLIKLNKLDPDELDRIRALKPKTHLPPKRYTVSGEQVITLIQKAKKLKVHKWPNYAILCVLFGTGIRASELCNMLLKDVDINRAEIYVKGKWGKGREIGLPPFALEALKEWLVEREKQDPTYQQPYVFLNQKGKKLDRTSVRTRLHKLGMSLGITVHPHALRRAFVTYNVAQGKPLEWLRRICDHEKISTTEKYCNTNHRTVVEDMKGWDLDLPEEA